MPLRSILVKNIPNDFLPEGSTLAIYDKTTTVGDINKYLKLWYELEEIDEDGCEIADHVLFHPADFYSTGKHIDPNLRFEEYYEMANSPSFLLFSDRF